MKSIDDIKKNWFAELIAGFIPDDIDISGKSPRQIITEYSKKSAAISFAASLPAGFLGWATILPEIALTTKMQINMIYSLAKYYNKNIKVDTNIISIIFAEALGLDMVKNFVMRTGGKIIISDLIKNGIKMITERISVTIMKRIARKLPARWIPLVMSPIYALWAYSSTKLIGKFAVNFLTKEIEYQIPADNCEDKFTQVQIN